LARNYYVNGQCLVKYNGSELGLTDNQGKVTIVPQFSYLPIEVDGFFQNPPERQVTLYAVDISMTLVHFDSAVFTQAVANSTQGSIEGTFPYGGKLLGANGGYGVLTLASPVQNAPWTFNSVYIKDHYTLPIGAERSLLEIIWTAVGYISDPWNNGAGAQGIVVYDN